VDAIVGLAAEMKGDEHALGWWRIYREATINQMWFDNLFDRLPRDSMDLHKHDAEYYLMENQEWVRIAAVHILKTSFLLCFLLATQGDDEECEAMRAEIIIDETEMTDREDVMLRVAEHRLHDGGQSDINLDYIRTLYNNDVQSAADFLHTLTINREHEAMRKKADAFVYEDPSDEDEIGKIDYDAGTALAVMNAAMIKSILRQVEFLGGSLALLHADLRNSKSLGSSQEEQKNQVLNQLCVFV
jgi:hypothetical protein